MYFKQSKESLIFCRSWKRKKSLTCWLDSEALANKVKLFSPHKGSGMEWGLENNSAKWSVIIPFVASAPLPGRNNLENNFDKDSAGKIQHINLSLWTSSKYCVNDIFVGRDCMAFLLRVWQFTWYSLEFVLSYILAETSIWQQRQDKNYSISQNCPEFWNSAWKQINSRFLFNIFFYWRTSWGCLCQ